MNISQRLRTCAKHTGLDAVIELLHEAADEIDALQARAQVRGEPSWWMRETDEGAEWTDTAPLVLSGWTPLYTTSQPAQATQAEAQQPDNAACKSVQKRLAAQQPATSEPVVSRNPFASRCYTMSESHLSGHRLIVGFEKLGDAQDAHEWVARQGRGDFTYQAPSVPADVVRVPLQVMKDASEALGNFVSDHGWGDADMQAMDNLDAYIARHEANRAAMLAAK